MLIKLKRKMLLSNKEELNRLLTEEFQKKAAESLYKSIIEALQN